MKSQEGCFHRPTRICSCAILSLGDDSQNSVRSIPCLVVTQNFKKISHGNLSSSAPRCWSSNPFNILYIGNLPIPSQWVCIILTRSRLDSHVSIDLLPNRVHTASVLRPVNPLFATIQPYTPPEHGQLIGIFNRIILGRY